MEHVKNNEPIAPSNVLTLGIVAAALSSYGLPGNLFSFFR